MHANDDYINDTTYAWTIEGNVTSGTLLKYAQDREDAHLSGFSISDTLWDGEATVTPVVSVSEYDANDYATVTVTLGEQTVHVRRDGRV